VPCTRCPKRRAPTSIFLARCLHRYPNAAHAGDCQCGLFYLVGSVGFLVVGPKHFGIVVSLDIARGLGCLYGLGGRHRESLVLLSIRGFKLSSDLLPGIPILLDSLVLIGFFSHNKINNIRPITGATHRLLAPCGADPGRCTSLLLAWGKSV
jgi:hypothetical protein